MSVFDTQFQKCKDVCYDSFKILHVTKQTDQSARAPPLTWL